VTAGIAVITALVIVAGLCFLAWLHGDK